MPIDRDDGEIMGPRPHGKLPMGHRTRAVYDECLAELIGGYPGLEGLHERVRIDRALLVLAGAHAIDVQKLVRQPVRDARNVNRSEERRAGKECVGMGRPRWCTYTQTKKTKQND